jgi:membrane protein
MTDSTAASNGEKRSARLPEGPAHARKGSLVQTLKRTMTEFSEDQLTDRAAALTYYAVLSIFPALIALISIVGLVADPATITRVLTDTISQLGPSSTVETLQKPIQEITASSGKAGLALIIGLAGALWTASGYVGAFMRASNAIYEIEEGRPFYKLRPLQILVTLILELMLAIVVLGLIVSGPLATAIGNAVGVGDTALTIFNIAKWPVLLVIVAVMLAILYYSAPNAKLPGFKWISPGSVVAVVIWIIASAAFAFYVANFGSYGKTYGTLGGAVTFLVWMWITNLAVLFGAELNAELERSRELEAGEPAEHAIQLPPRSTPKRKDKAKTA